MTLWADFLSRMMTSAGRDAAAGPAAPPGAPDADDPPRAVPGEPWPEPEQAEAAPAAAGPPDGR